MMVHSYPAGHNHDRGAESGHSGTKTIAANRTLAGKVKYLGMRKEVASNLCFNI